MRELVNVMKALSDPGRVKVLKMLEAREMCACDIIRLLGLAQPTVSRHLKVLVDAGLIKGRKVGSWVHYRLACGPGADNGPNRDSDPCSPYAQALLAALPGWLEADPEIKAMRQASVGLAPRRLSARQEPSPQDCCAPAAANP
ncbi:MAG: metalloregulator ArsR/SmtB family transcription factor [Humidesulfovibrio sp.]|nr:metalloregulator ArsR/SmtB family transcription factor [Humidesulfovibrio sp.]